MKLTDLIIPVIALGFNIFFVMFYLGLIFGVGSVIVTIVLRIIGYDR
jgi:hypothetical protein